MSFQPSDKAAFLDLWSRLFPRDYTTAIQAEGQGQGYDIVSAQAAIFARVSAALNETQQSYFARPHSDQTGEPASGEATAVGLVQVTRLPPVDYEVVLPQGLPLQATQLGTRGQLIQLGTVRVTADTTLPAGSVGPISVRVAAALPGNDGNYPAGRVSGFALLGRALVKGTVASATVVRDTQGAWPGAPTASVFSLAQVGQYVRPIGLSDRIPRRIVAVMQGTPNTAELFPPLAAVDVGANAEFDVQEFADLGLLIAQETAMSGGRYGMLEQAAADRSLARAPAESDASLRQRVSTLEDVVSPNAILHLCNRILSPLGVRFQLKETRVLDQLRGFFLDLDAFDFGDKLPITKLTGSVLVGDGAVLLSRAGSTRFFMVTVSIGNQGEFGAGYDSPMFPNSNAWDSLFFDGYPVAYTAAISALHQQIDRIKGAGVGYVVARDANL